VKTAEISKLQQLAMTQNVPGGDLMYERYHGKSAVSDCLSREPAIRRTVPPARQRPVQVFAFLAFLLLIALTVVLYLQVDGLLGRFETAASAPPARDPHIAAIDRQLDALQGKFSVLLAESVETRLKTLEKNIDGGRVNPDDLRAFEELKRDLRLLEGYADEAGVQPFDYNLVEHDRYRRLPEAGPSSRTQALLGEVSELRSLVYLCIGGVAASTLMSAGFWWRERRRARSIGTDRFDWPRLPAPSNDESAR
jgi:hypothetical protein